MKKTTQLDSLLNAPIRIFGVLGLILICCTPSVGANFSSNATGNWNATTTWTIASGTDADGIPDADDNVAITTGTITLNVAGVTINNLTCSGGSLIGVNDLHLTGNLTISGGTLGNDGNILVDGTLVWTIGTIGLSTLTTLTDVTITGLTTLSTSTKSLFKKKLILNGGGNWTAGDINFYNSSILEIPALQTLTYNAAANYSLGNGSGTNSVNIQGTLIKQGTGTLTANIGFNNTGEVNIGQTHQNSKTCKR